MKKVLIASFDMEVGGVERSLVSMLEHFHYDQYEVDLMLYRQQGDFLSMVSEKVNILPEIKQYTTFRKSIVETIKERQLSIAFTRIFSKWYASIQGKVRGIQEPGYYQMQLMWKCALPFLPKLNQRYDVAISYLWPHYFVAEKVQATTKIAWIHTDYSVIGTDIKLDTCMWDKFDYIVAVSEACKTSFVQKYPKLQSKVVVIENITSPQFIRHMANENVSNPMLYDSRFKIITVARLSHAKGIDQAVKALSLLKKKGYDFAWYVVGYGGDEQLIRALVQEYGLQESFILLGKKTNPYPFIQSADLYVQPSRYEGKAVTVVEAQILGKPVMITNYTTASSQVRHGYDGYITDLSVEGIVEGIECLYHNQVLRSDLAHNCQKINYYNNQQLNVMYNLFEQDNEMSIEFN